MTLDFLINDWSLFVRLWAFEDFSMDLKTLRIVLWFRHKTPDHVYYISTYRSNIDGFKIIHSTEIAVLCVIKELKIIVFLHIVNF